MGRVTVTIDEHKLMKELTVSNGNNKKIVNKIVKKEVDDKIRASKKLLLAEISEHKVSQEINRGPNAVSTSGTMSDLRGAGKRKGGNLFSFIGFEVKDKPISNLKRLINAPLNSRVRNRGVGKFNIDTDMPDLERVFEKTPFPWLNLSWVEGIERGITGLGEYIFGIFDNKAGSRSKRGLQGEKTIRSASFTPTPYLTSMYQKFYNRLRK